MSSREASITRLDSHVHTRFSHDCRVSVDQMLKAAQNRGLNALAITDHDTVEGIAEAERQAPRYGIRIVPGVEITCQGGTHLIGLFVRRLPDDLEILAVIDFIHQEGGLAVLPHLFRSDTGLFFNHQHKKQFTAQEVAKILKKVDLIELVNFKSQLRGEELPTAILQKFPKPVLGSTDAHYPFEVGQTWTELSISPQDLTPSALIELDKQIHYFPSLQPIPKRPTGLASYQMSTTSVTRLKKVIPPALVSRIGQLLLGWQEGSKQQQRSRQIEQALLKEKRGVITACRGQITFSHA